MSAAVLWVLAALALVGSAAGQEDGESFSERSTYEACECPTNSCLCVVYYLCDEDGVIKTIGTFLVGERLGIENEEPVSKCSGVQVCCQNPNMTVSSPPGSSPSVSTPEPVPAQTPESPLPVQPPENPPPTAGPSVPLREGCGFRRTSYDLLDIWSRIDSDESSTAFAEYPWMLALLRTDEANVNVFLCGASLIHPQVALTAAHCVSSWSSSQLVVRGGEWNTTSINEPLVHQDRSVSQIILHPDFFRGALLNDFALLELKEPFNAADNLDVVCLPEPDTILDKERCVATGWGRDTFGKEGTMQTTLRKVELPIVDDATCQARLQTTRLGIFFKLHESFICAGGELGKDTCKGDGGGPLMCPSWEDKGRYIQVGIVSWGIGCKDMQIPAVYADVDYARSWIDAQMTILGYNNNV